MGARCATIGTRVQHQTAVGILDSLNLPNPTEGDSCRLDSRRSDAHWGPLGGDEPDPDLALTTQWGVQRILLLLSGRGLHGG